MWRSSAIRIARAGSKSRKVESEIRKAGSKSRKAGSKSRKAGSRSTKVETEIRKAGSRFAISNSNKRFVLHVAVGLPWTIVTVAAGMSRRTRAMQSSSTGDRKLSCPGR